LLIKFARELTKQVVNEWNDEERQPLISDESVAQFHSWIFKRIVTRIIRADS
jgi:hypothetical protein